MNSATVFVIFAAVVASASAVNDIYAYPQYKYSYGVSDKLTGDVKNAAEVRDGGVTKGSYSLIQPDGVLRTVNYIVTPHGGFQAHVINKGVAGHPAIIGKGLGLGVAGLGAPLAVGGIGAPVAIGGLGLGGIGARSVVGGLGELGLGNVGLGGVGIGGPGLGGVGIGGPGLVGPGILG